MKKKKLNIHVMDVCLVVVAIIGIVFTAVMIGTYWRFGAIPDTLVVSVFGALFGECGCLALIQKEKVRKRDRQYELEDREYAENQQEKMRREAEQNGSDFEQQQ